MGYGTTNFTRSLVETYQRLAEQPVHDKDLQYISQPGEQIRTHPLTLMEGVQETLDYLLPHHNLFLLTKGDLEEQKLKSVLKCSVPIVLPGYNTALHPAPLESFERRQ